MSASLNPCAKLGITTPGIPSLALTPRRMTWIRLVGIGQVHRAVEREVRPHRERLARVVVTRCASGRVEARIGIELLPKAERRIGHRPRHSRSHRCRAICCMIDVGKVGREVPDVRVGKCVKTMRDGRHRARCDPVKNTEPRNGSCKPMKWYSLLNSLVFPTKISNAEQLT